MFLMKQMNKVCYEIEAIEEESNAIAITDIPTNDNTTQACSTRGAVRKRKRGMVKMIIVGSRASGKYGELIENAKGPSFRRMRDWVLGNVVKSVGPNKYQVKFDNGVVKDVASNVLRIEEDDSGIPVSEVVPNLEPVSEDLDDDEESNYSPDSEESDDALFPMDAAGVDDFPQSDGESNDDSNKEIEFNIGDVNAPADTPETNNDTTTPNESPSTYHEKLEKKRKELEDLLGKTIIRVQNKQSITWTVIKESVPEINHALANIREELKNKYGLKKLLELLCEHGHDDNESRGSCSFQSCTSSNMHGKTSSLKESTMFAELFLQLSYKDWKNKLDKMNRYVEDDNIKHPNKAIKLFTKSEFLTGHAIIIGASCYSQSGKALFSEGKDSDDEWDTITRKARFDRFMKLCRFKEFRYFLPKIYEQPLQKDTDPWHCFSSAVNEFNELRSELILSSYQKIIDESMSAWRPRTSKNGGLPNVSYIVRKPEPLGTEFKSVCCQATGVLTYLEIQRGKYVPLFH